MVNPHMREFYTQARTGRITIPDLPRSPRRSSAPPIPNAKTANLTQNMLGSACSSPLLADARSARPAAPPPPPPERVQHAPRPPAAPLLPAGLSADYDGRRVQGALTARAAEATKTEIPIPGLMGAASLQVPAAAYPPRRLPCCPCRPPTADWLPIRRLPCWTRIHRSPTSGARLQTDLHADGTP